MAKKKVEWFYETSMFYFSPCKRIIPAKLVSVPIVSVWIPKSLEHRRSRFKILFGLGSYLTTCRTSTSKAARRSMIMVELLSHVIQPSLTSKALHITPGPDTWLPRPRARLPHFTAGVWMSSFACTPEVARAFHNSWITRESSRGFHTVLLFRGKGRVEWGPLEISMLR